ncbi:MAG: 7-cyano-7-deazaguanine synthase [Candidatus Omnitrophica bacterium]|nr:7-cyano-7-deazaguanine synthase [Candidatus Omnitrophota bacterium]
MKRITLLYSGGVDSTAAAVILSKQFDQVHLLSFNRFGLFNIERTAVNTALLKEKFGADRFQHTILEVNKLFRMISYSKYCSNLLRHGFFVLSTCGLCKLSMHVRAIIYCLDNDIRHVADGANKHMFYFPDQTIEYIREIKALYAKFGIEYLNPVYDFDCPEENIDWFNKLGVKANIISGNGKDNPPENPTTSQLLFQEGLSDGVNAKAEKTNQNAQARCFQLTLFNIFLHWYFLPSYGMEKYKQTVSVFYKEKTGFLSGMLTDYANDKKNSLLRRYLE